jgi:hypothetical protein
MWFILQSLIVFAVMASNIAWQWTPNSYLAGLLAVGAAFFVTMGVNQLLLWARKKPGNRAR